MSLDELGGDYPRSPKPKRDAHGHLSLIQNKKMERHLKKRHKPEFDEIWSKHLPIKEKKMHKRAYEIGSEQACSTYGVKTAQVPMGMLGRAANFVGKGMNAVGHAASVVPVVGNAFGAVASGVGGAVQGLAQGEGMKGALVRGGIGAGTSLIPGGLGIAAGLAGDQMANKMLAKPRMPGIA